MHSCKLLMTNDKGRKQSDLAVSAQTKSSLPPKIGHYLRKQ
jgi:hypothetical protein